MYNSIMEVIVMQTDRETSEDEKWDAFHKRSTF